MKKLMSLLLVALLLVSAVPFHAAATEVEETPAASVAEPASEEPAEVPAEEPAPVEEPAEEPASEKKPVEEPAPIVEDEEEEEDEEEFEEEEEEPSVLDVTVTVLIGDGEDNARTMTESRDADWSATTKAILTEWFKLDMVNGYSFKRVWIEGEGTFESMSTPISAGDNVRIRIYEVKKPEDTEPEDTKPEDTTPEYDVVITFKNSKDKTDNVVIYANYGDKITIPSLSYVNGYDKKGWEIDGELYGAGDTYKVTKSTPAELTATAKYKKTSEDDENTLKVYARLRVGGITKKTVLIHQNNTMMSNDKILKYLLDDEINAELWNVIENKFPGYSWSGHFYNAYGDQAATNNITTVDGSKTIYINLYHDDKDVMVYIHTNSTSSYDRIIEIDGYLEGDTISSSAVLTEVKNYYSGSNMSLTMYDEDGWKDYKDGKKNTSTKYVTVEGDVTKIHVVLKNASSVASGSVADSSNPKTGDEIFMAVTAMAVSASALALMFFFNKKRAVK